MNRKEKRESEIIQQYERGLLTQKETIKKLKLPHRHSIYQAYHRIRMRTLKEANKNGELILLRCEGQIDTASVRRSETKLKNV